MYFKKIPIFFLIFFIIFKMGQTLICWSCSNNPHDQGKNPCPDDFKSININHIQTEQCFKDTSCLIKLARRDKGPLRPIKSGCIRINKTQSGIPGGKCQSGVGLEISKNKLPKHFTSSFCTIQCDTNLCDYRIARKFL